MTTLKKHFSNVLTEAITVIIRDKKSRGIANKSLQKGWERGRFDSVSAEGRLRKVPTRCSCSICR